MFVFNNLTVESKICVSEFFGSINQKTILNHGNYSPNMVLHFKNKIDIGYNKGKYVFRKDHLTFEPNRGKIGSYGENL